MNHHCRIGAITFRWNTKPPGVSFSRYYIDPDGRMAVNYWHVVSMSSDGKYVRYEPTSNPYGSVSRASRQRSKASRKPKRVTGK